MPSSLLGIKYGMLTPEPKKKDERDSIYPIKKGVVYIGLHYNSLIDNFIYKIYEPPITAVMKEIIDGFPKYMVIHYRGEPLSLKYMNDMLNNYLKYNDIHIGLRERQTILYYVERNMFFYEELTPLLDDDMIEDISLTGIRKPIYIYHRLVGSIPTTLYFKTEEEANHYVNKLAEKAIPPLPISYRNPIQDGTLPEKHRINLTLGNEITAAGPTFSVRRYKTNPITIFDMVKSGMLSFDVLAYLWLLVEFHRNIMILGPTASGKTTTLDALLTFIKRDDKIFTIEDTHELFIDHHNWVGTITRSGIGIKSSSGRQMGEVDEMSLLKASLRQRPDYLIVGEARGEETKILFQAMATGHTSFTTFHASDIMSLISRIESDPINLNKSNLTILSDIIIMQSFIENRAEVRRIKEIDEIKEYNPINGEIIYENAVKYVPNMPPGEQFIIDMMSTSPKEISKRLSQESESQRLAKFQEELLRRSKYLASIDFVYNGNISKSDIRKFIHIYPLLKDIPSNQFVQKVTELSKSIKVVT
ncbi:MAG: type II/IV secretion system ATPase subunit [Thermoplasmata archaeon]